MLRRLLCILALVFSSFPGCGDGGAEVSKKQFTLLGELRDTLTKVRDGATLKAELPKLEAISKQLAAAQAELNKQQVSTEQQRDIRAKYGKDLESLNESIYKETDRIDSLANVDEKERDRLVAAVTAVSTVTTP